MTFTDTAVTYALGIPQDTDGKAYVSEYQVVASMTDDERSNQAYSTWHLNDADVQAILRAHPDANNIDTNTLGHTIKSHLYSTDSNNTCGPVAITGILDAVMAEADRPTAGNVFSRNVRWATQRLSQDRAWVLTRQNDFGSVTSSEFRQPGENAGTPEDWERLNATIVAYGLSSLRPVQLNVGDEKGIHAWSDNGNIKSQIDSRKGVIILVSIDVTNYRGQLVDPRKYSDKTKLVGHFAVIAGYATNWDNNNEESHWIKLFNPFNNHFEYYKWEDAWLSMIYTGDGWNTMVVINQ